MVQCKSQVSTVSIGNMQAICSCGVFKLFWELMYKDVNIYQEVGDILLKP